MTLEEIARLRLSNQQIQSPRYRRPDELLSHMGAMQGQDYAGSLWAMGLRLSQAVITDIEQAVVDRQIVRSWPLRRTLHWVPAADLGWMLQLTGPRMVAGTEGRRRQLGLTDAELSKARSVVATHLQTPVTRPGLYALLASNGISMDGGRGLHLICRLAMEGLICFGPHIGKQPSFVLLEAWVTNSRQLGGDEALVELAKRYFTSHGPATVNDFAWWSGLTLTQCRQAIAAAGQTLQTVDVAGVTYLLTYNQAKTAPNDAYYLLPPFDEYIISYKDRLAVLDPLHTSKINPGSNGMFMPTIVVNGRVVGVWKRTHKAASVEVGLQLFEPAAMLEAKKIAPALDHYGQFLRKPAKLLA